MSVGRYLDADAFRRSLEQRIATASLESGLPHDRLRKAIGFHRLVARFLSVEDRRWAIKGGAGLLWRVGHDVRATKDVDANWAGGVSHLDGFLDAAVGAELGDWFGIEIGAPRPLRGEAGNAFRYAVSVRLAGRESPPSVLT